MGDGKSRGPCPWESDGVGRGLWKDKEGSTGAKHLESEGILRRVFKSKHRANSI